MILNILLILVSLILSFIVSYIFLSLYVYDKSNRKILDKFSYIYSLSNTLFISILLEIADIGDKNIRHYFWKIILFIFSIIMFYILPFFMIKTLSSRTYKKITYILFTIYLLGSCIIYNQYKKREFLNDALYLLINNEYIEEYIGIISILITSILSGYSNIQCIFNYIIHPYVLDVNSIDSLKDFITFKTTQLIMSLPRMAKKRKPSNFSIKRMSNQVENNEESLIEEIKKEIFIEVEEEEIGIIYTMRDIAYVLYCYIIRIEDDYKYEISNESQESQYEDEDMNEKMKGKSKIRTRKRLKLDLESKKIIKIIEIYNKYLNHKNTNTNVKENLNINYKKLITKIIISYIEFKKTSMILSIKKLKESILFGINWIIYFLLGKIMAYYSIYRILITIKNLFLSNYSEINLMFKEEVLTIIDKLVGVFFIFLNFDIENLFYSLLEQYFSIIVVGVMLIVNMRGFLNTIHFLYTRAINKISINRNFEVLFMSYFIGMFYMSAIIFIIFSLPLTYRISLFNIYSKLDYSLLKYYSDRYFLISVFFFSCIEFILIAVFIIKNLIVQNREK